MPSVKLRAITRLPSLHLHYPGNRSQRHPLGRAWGGPNPFVFAGVGRSIPNVGAAPFALGFAARAHSVVGSRSARNGTQHGETTGSTSGESPPTTRPRSRLSGG